MRRSRIPGPGRLDDGDGRWKLGKRWIALPDFSVGSDLDEVVIVLGAEDIGETSVVQDSLAALLDTR